MNLMCMVQSSNFGNCLGDFEFETANLGPIYTWHLISIFKSDPDLPIIDTNISVVSKWTKYYLLVQWVQGP
jgi:hypothetical protein